jgi:SAM-dependent methyltransferase
LTRTTDDLAMQDSRLHAPFPGKAFVSYAEFDDHCRDMQDRLDSQYLYQQGLGIAEPVLIREGTCAPCLRACRFTAATAGGEVLEDGRVVPNWREQQVCDCDDHLGNRRRALLHFLETMAGMRSWTRVLAFGGADPLERRIAAVARELATIRRMLPGFGATLQRLDAADASFDLVLSSDYLHLVPPLERALSEVRRVLVPGGQFVFTVPFRYRAEKTVSRTGYLRRTGGRLPPEFGGEVHEIGWDVLGLLRGGGFSDARAWIYWSDELGYLGTFNTIFVASA